MSTIDPIEFGRLAQAVETLTIQVGTMQAQIQSLQQQLTGGKGVMLGLMIAAGGLGAGASKAIDHLFR